MKTKNLPSLIICFLLLLSFNARSQDSINYYKKTVATSNSVLDLIKAYEFFKKNKLKNEKREYHIGTVYDLLQLAAIQDKLGQYYDSEASAIEGIFSIDTMPVNETTIPYKKYLLNRLGIIKRKMMNYKRSLEYYSKVLDIAQNKSDSIIAYNNIGIAYIYMEEYNQARKALNKAYEYSLMSKDSNKIGLTLSNFGYVRARLGEEKEGVSMMKKSIEIRNKIECAKLYESYEKLVDFYKYKRDTVEAVKYAEESYRIAKKNNTTPYLDEALSNLVDLKQYKYLNRFKELRDSLRVARSLIDNKYSGAKYYYYYEDIKKKAENDKLKAYKAEVEVSKMKIREEEQKFREVISQIVGGFILLSSIFLFYHLRTRHKKEKLQERYATEQKISKKLHDEVANDVFYVMTKMENESNSPELIENLERIYNKTRDISKANAPLDLGVNFGVELKGLIQSYQTDVVNIFTRNLSEIGWQSLNTLKKETLYRVLQELMTNMKKHSKATLVTVRFEKQLSKIVVVYQDNGIGGKLKKSSGLRNTENRMELAGGSITFESETNKGFHAKIVI